MPNGDAIVYSPILAAPSMQSATVGTPFAITFTVPLGQINLSEDAVVVGPVCRWDGIAWVPLPPHTYLLQGSDQATISLPVTHAAPSVVCNIRVSPDVLQNLPGISVAVPARQMNRLETQVMPVAIVSTANVQMPG